jgi:hypothetical protein
MRAYILKEIKRYKKSTNPNPNPFGRIGENPGKRVRKALFFAKIP